MLISAISSALSQPNSSAGVNPQKQNEFQQLAQALETGNLSSAQQLFGTLTGSSSSAAGATAANSNAAGVLKAQLTQEFGALGMDLQSGNLSAAQQAYSALHKALMHTNDGAPIERYHPSGGSGGGNSVSAGVGALLSALNSSNPGSSLVAPVSLTA